MSDQTVAFLRPLFNSVGQVVSLIPGLDTLKLLTMLKQVATYSGLVGLAGLVRGIEGFHFYYLTSLLYWFQKNSFGATSN